MEELRATLNPVRLLQEIRAAQQQLVEIADRPVRGERQNLYHRHWSNSSRGCARHRRRVRYARPAKQRRSPSDCRAGPIRSQPSRPSCGVGSRAEPWHTSRELLERLETEHPDVYPDGQLRTSQRRLHEWRRAAAHQMVFGTMTANPRIALTTTKAVRLAMLRSATSANVKTARKAANASPTTSQGQHQ
jgi:hypothetical protein